MSTAPSIPPVRLHPCRLDSKRRWPGCWPAAGRRPWWRTTTSRSHRSARWRRAASSVSSSQGEPIMIARSFAIAFGIVAASVAVGARAEEDVLSNSLRVGAYYLMYDTHADDIQGPYVPNGVNLKV